MLQKINLKILGISFIALLLVVIVIQISNNKPERNFRTHLVEIDTADIQRIEIIKFEGNTLELVKNSENKWNVKQLEKSSEADFRIVKDFILSLNNLQIKRRVGANKKQWRKCEVNDSLGAQVHVYGTKEELANLVVGKFSYKRRGQGVDITTYARMNNEEETYEVDGQLSMMTRRDFNGFRSHIISKVSPDDIEKIEFTYPADSSFVLQKENNHWKIDGNETDSTTTIQYINELKNIEAYNFVSVYNPKEKEVYKIVVKKSSGQSYEIEAYQDGENYIIRTSLNENAFFSESKQTFDRLFFTKRT